MKAGPAPFWAAVVAILVAAVAALALALPAACGGEGPAPASLDLPKRLAAEGISGGLVVHVGFSRPSLALDLPEDRRFVLHALNRDAGQVDEARTWLQEKGIVQRAIVECVAGPKLPHADHLASAVVIEDGSGFDPREFDRVLSPHGLLLRRQGGMWQGTVKPMPPELDAWPYVDHDAGRTRVSADRTIAAPTNVRWLTRTRFRARLPVVAGGRMFCTITGEPPFVLAAYSVFTGTVLWTGSYECQEQPPNLIATDRLVYVPGKALAADTGEVRRTYGGCPRALTGDVLVVFSATGGKREFSAARPDGGKVIWTQAALDGVGIGQERFVLASADGPELRACDIATGRALWTQDVGKVAKQIGLDDLNEQWAKGGCTLTATGQHVAVCCGGFVGPPNRRRPSGKRFILLFSAEDGSFVRAVGFAPSPSDGWSDGKGNRRAESVFTLSGGNLWCWMDPEVDVETCGGGRSEWQSLGTQQAPGPGGPAAQKARIGLVGISVVDGRRLLAARTEVEKPADMTLHCFSGPVWSPRYGFRGRLNTIDLSDGHIASAVWAGGGCCLANIPAYGLHLVGPNWTHAGGGLTGLLALECRPASDQAPAEALGADHLEKGPVYGDAMAAAHLTPRGSPALFPYNVPPSSAEWRKAWEVAIESDRVKVGRGLLPEGTAWLIPPPFGRPRADEHHSWSAYCSPPSVSLCGKMMLVLVPEERRLLALDSDSGRLRWEFAAAARFAGEPIWCGDLCLVGNWDGWIYAIRMADGKLAWRNLVGPADRRIMWEEKPISAWPVTGQLLIQDGRVYAAAGLHTLVPAGGATLACFDVRTGKMVWKRRVPSVVPPEVAQAREREFPGGVLSMSALGVSPVPVGSAVRYGPFLFALQDGAPLTPVAVASAAGTTPLGFLVAMALAAREPNVATVLTQDGILQCFRRAPAGPAGQEGR